MSLNLFPARAPVGRVTLPNGTQADVLMTPEFSRALAALSERVGGPNGMDANSLALLASFSDAPTVHDASIQFDQSEQVAALQRRVDELEAKIEALTGQASETAELRKTVLAQALEQAFAPPPTDWEHPGMIGAQSPNTAEFTNVYSSGLVRTEFSSGFQLEEAGVMIGKLHYNGGVALSIVAGTPFKVICNSVETMIVGATGDTTVAGGFGCNGASAQTEYSLGSAATDLPTVISLANNLRTMAINNGMGTT